MNKNRGSVGRVVHPTGGTGLTVVNTSSQQQQAMYGGQPQYPQYEGGYSNPAAAPGYNGPTPGPAYPPSQPVNPPSYGEQKT
ncbi:hypothetical protein FSP39_000953 [Pinctada imbricata]|uniref:Uncharacterized protein n=1 Tax=Pinctada imbricata TaxID=66713 RepID=A0AA89C619_PINIB|nr:hypothetical protein FSP39_000953 [Pinctada imbricata]